MIDGKVLIVAPYPIANPQHGGQKRAKAIFDFYKKNFSDVIYVGVFHRGQYPEWGENDLLLGDPQIIAQVDQHPYMSELLSGEAIDKDIHVRSYMAKLLMEYQPKIMHIEQPFAYLGLKQLMSELGISPFLIFGSQNIEYILKERIFKELIVEPTFAEEIVRKIRHLEYELSQDAKLTIAVNREDAESHKKMGAKKCIVAPNGIERTIATEADRDYWRKFKNEINVNTLFTFVGSGHPPNWEGFLQLVGKDTRFIPANCKIVIAGGVADYFDKAFTKENADFWHGIQTVGKLEEGRLAALLELSEVILLPITTKRGSNLKTAEAILSQKKIVATSNTFHGFEKFRKLPNVYIGDTQKQFRKAILEAYKTPRKDLSHRQRRLIERVQWDYCLRPMSKAIREILLIEKLKQIARSFRFG